MTDNLLLETRELYKSFDHEGRTINVLQGINLRVKRGEQIAVVGQSGAGKSTLLNILGVLDLPSRGEILFEGQSLLQKSARELAAFRNDSIGFMFQFHHLLSEFSALENVMMPALIGRKSRSEAAKQAEELLESVGLSDRLKHRPAELSGGEQQRVALARALVGKPKLLLADEPTGNLDSHTSTGIHDLFEHVNQVYGTAMLIVTHNKALADSMPRQLVMRDGKLVSSGDEQS